MEPNKYRFGGCSFELEICLLPAMGSNGPPNSNPRNPLTPSKNPQPSQTETPIKSSMKHGANPPTSSVGNGAAAVPQACVGIRRKRLKGDSWCYKRVCEQVLALTATDLRQQIGSPV